MTEVMPSQNSTNSSFSAAVLVQPEMESWRSTLASIPPFSAGQLGGHRPMQWRLVEQAAAETGRPVPLRFLKTTIP